MRLFTTGLTITLTALALGLIATSVVQSAERIPLSAVSGSASQVSLVQVAFEDSVRVHAEAARSLKTDAFGSVFADDPAVPLTSAQITFLERWVPARVAGAGYLTYMRGYFEKWQRGDAARKRVIAARNAGQPPDSRDVAIVMFPRYDPWTRPTFEYKSIQVVAGVAHLEAVGDGQIYRVTLVDRGGRWLVAGENNTPLEDVQ